MISKTLCQRGTKFRGVTTETVTVTSPEIVGRLRRKVLGGSRSKLAKVLTVVRQIQMNEEAGSHSRRTTSVFPTTFRE
ncbi:hypothetical protein BaRGS_00014703 [Batillaria attramentaria]|uniref:Uncharacterized protein n=1 Tax=Batillaria attramentaria TaxID=370345 RepID=A0ABD0L3J5_9CAEN